MDTVSQFALGAAVGVAVLGRRTALWKAALAGGVCGTLPDLDVFIDHGDPVSNMTLHRGETHALFWLTLASPLIAGLLARLNRAGGVPWHRWWFMVWLALVTHPLLDAMTVYGTRLGLPFTDFPYAVGSIFIIDPLYTLPLLIGLGLAVGRQRPGFNTAGLALSSAYLAWSVLAQQYVAAIATQQARAQGIQIERLLVTPAPFTTLLWRIVIVSPDGHYHEGFRALLDDADTPLAFDRYSRGNDLLAALRSHPPVARMEAFARGFIKLERERESEGSERIVLSDLRMGLEPTYTFAFIVARTQSPTLVPVTPASVGRRPDVPRVLAWMARRMRGEALPPPR
jgi:inner membrane protein